MRFRFPIVVLLSLLFGCSENSLTYEEASRSLKILNSDIVNLFTKGAELPELQAMKFLLDQPSVPLPFTEEKFNFDKPYSEFDFDRKKGIYNWDRVAKQFIRTGNSEKISIYFPLNSTDSLNASFDLAKYESVPISSRPQFPVGIQAQLTIDKSNSLVFVHSGAVEDDLPLTMVSSLTGNDYQLAAGLNRTKRGEQGTLDLTMSLKIKGNEQVSGSLHATIGYSIMGYFFEEINLNCTLFNHLVKGRINYGKINSTADNYIRSFNQNTNIEIFDLHENKKVGNIVLGGVGNNDSMNYFVKFPNGKEELVSQYIPVIDKILNFKY